MTGISELKPIRDLILPKTRFLGCGGITLIGGCLILTGNLRNN